VIVYIFCFGVCVCVHIIHKNIKRDEELSGWNLRKCSAACLDTIANVFKRDILPILLPHLRSMFADQQSWIRRESGILALGAIAEGCYFSIQPHLVTLVPFLIGLLRDKKVNACYVFIYHVFV